MCLFRCDLPAADLARGRVEEDRGIVARENFIVMRAFAKQNFLLSLAISLPKRKCRAGTRAVIREGYVEPNCLDSQNPIRHRIRIIAS